MTQSTIRLTVNGRIHDVDAAPDTALLYVLRNDLELNGPKYGCGLGECGACAVLIDGVAARSCVIPIEGCVGRDIVTLEGLGSREQSRSGAAGLHRRTGRAMRLLPQRHDHRHQGAAQSQRLILPRPRCMEALRYHLCRCGAHIEIMRAAMRAAGHARRGGRLMTDPDAPTSSELGPARCRWFARPAPARAAASRPSSRSRPTARSPPSTAMSISAPASAPRSARSSPRNSTCPLPASSSCSATPRSFPIRARPLPAKPSRSRRCRCARPRRRRGISWWRAPRQRLELAGRRSHRSRTA